MDVRKIVGTELFGFVLGRVPAMLSSLKDLGWWVDVLSVVIPFLVAVALFISMGVSARRKAEREQEEREEREQREAEEKECQKEEERERQEREDYEKSLGTCGRRGCRVLKNDLVLVAKDTWWCSECLGAGVSTGGLETSGVAKAAGIRRDENGGKDDSWPDRHG